GLALHNYHDTHSVFPYSTSAKGSCESGSAMPAPGTVKNHRGWVLVLPFLEQGNLYEQFNPDLAAGNYDRAGTGLLGEAVASGNAAVVSQTIEAFLCPSDDGNPKITTTSEAYQISSSDTNFQGAKTSYDFQGHLETSGCTLWSSRARNTRYMFGTESN